MDREHDATRDFIRLENTAFLFWGINVESPMGGEAGQEGRNIGGQ